MTYYDQHIKPAMHADPQWQTLTRQIDATREKLAQLETQRMNFEGQFIAKMVNGPQGQCQKSERQT